MTSSIKVKQKKTLEPNLLEREFFIALLKKGIRLFFTANR